MKSKQIKAWAIIDSPSWQEKIMENITEWRQLEVYAARKAAQRQTIPEIEVCPVLITLPAPRRKGRKTKSK